MNDVPLMQGAPPPAAAQVTLANWRRSPFNRWSFQRVREIVPTAAVRHAPESVRGLPAARVDLSGLGFTVAGAQATVAQMLDATDADAMLVLHRGRIVFEHYRNGMDARTPHILMSVSKSVTAVVAGVLAGQGSLDQEAPVVGYVPEIAGSAFDGASVRHLLDMRVGLRFEENYLATSGPIIDYRYAMGWNQPPIGHPLTDLRSFLVGMRERAGEHGGPMRYISPCTDLLGWVIERAAGRGFPELLSELLWRPMGAAEEASVTVDRLGASRVAGGISTTAGDLARLGQLLLEDGVREGRRVVPTEWIADMRRNGDRKAWVSGDFNGAMGETAWRYRSLWYVMDEGEAPFLGIGIHGQYLFVDPANEVVIAKFSSQPEPADDVKDRLAIAAFCAIGRALGAG